MLSSRKLRMRLFYLRIFTAVILFALSAYPLEKLFEEINGECSEQAGKSQKPVIIQRNPFNWTIVEKDFCTKRYQNLRILIVVHSATSHFERRQILREMYGDRFYKQYGIAMLFFVGISVEDVINDRIEDESFTHRDIIQQNFLDVYRNMTWKALAWLRFVDEYCKTPQYVLKIDDDVVFDLYALVNYLRIHIEELPRIDRENLFICGLIDVQGLAPSRDPSFKWCVTKEEYECDYYHPYCFGMQYIISPKIAKKLLNASVGEKYFWIDDYFITGHLGHKTNASYHHIGSLRGNKEGLLNGTTLFWLIENGDMNEGKEIWQKIRER